MSSGRANKTWRPSAAAATKPAAQPTSMFPSGQKTWVRPASNSAAPSGQAPAQRRNATWVRSAEAEPAKPAAAAAARTQVSAPSTSSHKWVRAAAAVPPKDERTPKAVDISAAADHAPQGGAAARKRHATWVRPRSADAAVSAPTAAAAVGAAPGARKWVRPGAAVAAKGADWHGTVPNQQAAATASHSGNATWVRPNPLALGGGARSPAASRSTSAQNSAARHGRSRGAGAMMVRTGRAHGLSWSWVRQRSAVANVVSSIQQGTNKSWRRSPRLATTSTATKLRPPKAAASGEAKSPKLAVQRIFAQDVLRKSLRTARIGKTYHNRSVVFSKRATRAKKPFEVPVCSFFLRGVCTNDQCPYRHVNKPAAVCPDFKAGFCAKGDQCELPHVRPRRRRDSARDSSEHVAAGLESEDSTEIKLAPVHVPSPTTPATRSQAGTPSQKRASRCHCGADLPRSARFCPMCGDKAASTAESEMNIMPWFTLLSPHTPSN